VQAEASELLSGKGKFSSEQAVVLATAIDMGIEEAQFVTVPILDARFAVADARTTRLEARVDSGFASVVASLGARVQDSGPTIDRHNHLRRDSKDAVSASQGEGCFDSSHSARSSE
jgi:hypothetical protein